MIDEFIDKCNFDSNSIIINIGETIINIDGYKLYDPFILNEISFDEFCSEQNIKNIDLLIINSIHYNKILTSEILNRTQYIYLEYIPPEDRTQFSLPGEGWLTRFDTGSGIIFENFEYLELFIESSGAWNSKNTNEHLFDSSLAYCISNYLKDNKINNCIDLGCGDGSYTKYFNEEHIFTEGYDGNPFTSIMTNNLCKIIDLSKDFDFNKKYDCVMSLEVGEHIPKCYEQIFIKNIIKHAGNIVILSWAIPGQGGRGHVNCLENSYIKKIFKDKGFENRPYAENILRQSATQNWFKNTIMVFKKKD